MPAENITCYIRELNESDNQDHLRDLILPVNAAKMIETLDFDDGIVEELQDVAANGNQFLRLQQAAAERLIQLRIADLRLDALEALNNMAKVQSNADLFTIFDAQDHFNDLNLQNKNFSDEFYETVATFAKRQYKVLVKESVKPVIAIATNAHYITALAALCNAKLNDAALDQEIKRHLREIPQGAVAGTEAPDAVARAGDKYLTPAFPAESLELVVDEVKQKVIQNLVAAAKIAKDTALVGGVVGEAPAPAAAVDEHNNYIDTLSINQCVARMKASIGPDLDPAVPLDPRGTSLKNVLALAKQTLGDKTVSDYKKAKERIEIAAHGTLGRYLVTLTDEQTTVDRYEAVQTAQRKLYLATEQLERVERQLSLVEAADKKLNAFKPGDDQLKLISEQKHVVTELQRIAHEAAKKLVPVTLAAAVTVNDAHKATTGYVVNQRTVLKTTTCKLSDVTDLRAEAQIKIDGLLRNAPPARAARGPESAIEGGEAVFYQNMRLEEKEHKLTTAYINNKKGVLLLAQDSKGTIRDFSTASNEPLEPERPVGNGPEATAAYRCELQQYKKDIQQYKQDLLDKAFTHAQERLDTFTGGKIYLSTPEGEQHDGDAANRLYAALLVVAANRGIKNMEIVSYVHECDGPDDHWSRMGKDNAGFIHKHLSPFGYTPGSMKEKLLQDKSAYNLFIKGVKPEDKPMHGDITPSPKPK